MSVGDGAELPGAARMARRHSGPATRDELAPGMLMRALEVGVEDESAAAGERADPAPNAARARVVVVAAIAGTALLAGVLGPGAGAGRYSAGSGSNVRAAAGVAGSVESQGDSFVKTKKFSSDVVLGAAAAAAVSMSALAGDAVQWRVADGGNGHWYRLSRQATPLGWNGATQLSEAAGGHLATLTTAAEDAWVRAQIVAPANIPALQGGPWIGARCEGENWGAWRWITGETWDYSAWAGSEPNNGGGREYYVQMYQGQNMAWNDNQEDGRSSTFSAVIEWEADCNSDGIVDYGQILAGTLDDANANGVPDRCECAANPGLPSCCLGDIVNDRTVNGADLGTLLAFWGPVTSGAFSIASDLNKDGHIDGADLGILLAYWGACPTANVPAWATLIEAMPDPTVVTDPALRTAIAATGLAWRVRDTATQIEMLLVPPGTFQMGCTASNLSGCNDDENPAHSVTLTQAFYLGRYELTQGQWVAKLVSNPSSFQGYSDSVNRPVEQVTWNAAQDYMLITGMRLPSEAEWEFACRAGTTTAFNNGSNDDNTAANVAWYVENSGGQTHAVGNKAANALGFYDMTGNVWEWVNDWYDSSYYSMSPSTNPGGPVSGTTRVLRGGSWYYDSGKVRSSYRSTYGGTGVDFGFRVARNP